MLSDCVINKRQLTVAEMTFVAIMSRLTSLLDDVVCLSNCMSNVKTFPSSYLGYDTCISLAR